MLNYRAKISRSKVTNWIAHVCEQLAQDRYLTAKRPGVEPGSRPLTRKSKALTITPPKRSVEITQCPGMLVRCVGRVAQLRLDVGVVR